MKKQFKVCISSRYMYNDYLAYNVYTMDVKNMNEARKLAELTVDHWNKNDISTRYYIFDIWAE